MKLLYWFWLAPLPLAAHMVSMSTGELRVEDRRATFELRMPLYEITHLENKAPTLLDHVTFSTAAGEGRLIRRNCRPENDEGVYYCTGVFEFPEAVDRLEVSSTLHSVTVPHHVHILKASKGEARQQAVLDLSFPKAEIRFQPPTGWEIGWTQFGAGALRAVGGAAQLLFLAGIALAARSRRELAALAAAFLGAVIAAPLLAPALAGAAGWELRPRFVESAAALTIAYLAFEILLLPNAGRRWLVVGALGVFHGLYFHLFLTATGYHAGYVLAGVSAAGLLLIAVFAAAIGRLKKSAAFLRPVQAGAVGMLAIGMFWFVMRVAGN